MAVIEILGLIYHVEKKLESLHSEEIQQNEKATYWTQEDICKWHIQHGVNKQIIQRTHTVQHDKTNQRNEWKTIRDIFPKKTYGWPTGKWKDAQHH